MNFFKPEDFALISGFRSGKDTADAANKLLSERGVRVYGFANKHGWYKPDTESNQYATHQALLINIEELPKPECAHEPTPVVDGDDFWLKCKHCEIKLKASWSPA